MWFIAVGGAIFPAEEIQAILHEHHKKCHALKHLYTDKCKEMPNVSAKLLFESTSEIWFQLFMSAIEVFIQSAKSFLLPVKIKI